MTDDAIAIRFSIPENLKEYYQFSPGQYVTLKLIVDNDEVRRAYSISSPPFEESIEISVKLVKGGKGSTFLHNEINEGDEILVSTPEGKFIVIPEQDNQNDYYFIAGGSGITPIMSMMATILEKEPISHCHLLYGSRDEDHIMYNSRISQLEEKYKDQLYVTYTLSQPNKQKAKGVSGLLGVKKSSWLGLAGRIDREKIKSFLEKHPQKGNEAFFYLCGPGNMIETAEDYLNTLTTKSHIKKELFTLAGVPSPESCENSNGSSTVKIILEGSETTLIVKEGETILEAALRLGIDAPYSCSSGACSSCLALKKEGEIGMDVYYAIEDDEVEKGYILTCQARVQSSSATITYDV